VVRRIESSLAAGGFKLSRDSVAGRQTVIGRQATFVRRRIHVFVLIAVFKADATPGHLDRFLEEAVQYACTARGRSPSRSQPGICAVAVAVVDAEPGSAVVGWPARAQETRSSAVAYPVLVMAAGRRVITPEGLPGGAGPQPYLVRLVADHVGTASG